MKFICSMYFNPNVYNIQVVIIPEKKNNSKPIAMLKYLAPMPRLALAALFSIKWKLKVHKIISVFPNISIIVDYGFHWNWSAIWEWVLPFKLIYAHVYSSFRSQKKLFHLHISRDTSTNLKNFIFMFMFTFIFLINIYKGIYFNDIKHETSTSMLHVCIFNSLLFWLLHSTFWISKSLNFRSFLPMKDHPKCHYQEVVLALFRSLSFLSH